MDETILELELGPTLTDAPTEEPSLEVDAELVQKPATEEEPEAESSPEETVEPKGKSHEESLLAEIKRLKDELARRDSMAERFAKEGEEFCTLYPNTDMQQLPDSVWQDVGRGVPLAAAYALFERRRYYTEQKAAEYNHTNMRRSSGSLEPTEPDYYSPAEVRAMSQSEVRANYDKIMRSMQKWH